MNEVDRLMNLKIDSEKMSLNNPLKFKPMTPPITEEDEKVRQRVASLKDKQQQARLKLKDISNRDVRRAMEYHKIGRAIENAKKMIAIGNRHTRRANESLLIKLNKKLQTI